MNTEFGKRLREARKHAKLTQVQLAKLAGMVQASVSDLELAGQGSSFTPAIAKACGVSVQWLAYGKGAMLDKDAPPKPESKALSTNAMALALMYDNLPDDEPLRTRRMRAAINALLGLERQSDNQYTDAPAPSVKKEKRHA